MLVARLKAGDERAFEVLVRRESGRLLAAVRRLVRDEAAAHDCVQEAFLSAFRAIDSFEPRSSIGAWLHRIAINAALMRLRKQRRLAETPIDDLLPSFDADGWRRDTVDVPDGDPESELERRRYGILSAARSTCCLMGTERHWCFGTSKAGAPKRPPTHWELPRAQ